MKVPEEGDKSIQTYGDAAPDDDFTAIDQTVRAYHLAMADRDISALCGLLATHVRKGLALLAKRSGKVPDKVDCVTLLRRTVPELPGDAARAYRRVRVTDARTDGDKGFAFLTVPGQGPTALSIAKDDGGWKIATLGSVPLD